MSTGAWCGFISTWAPLAAGGKPPNSQPANSMYHPSQKAAYFWRDPPHSVQEFFPSEKGASFPGKWVEIIMGDENLKTILRVYCAYYIMTCCL